jgi:hypothetical protein
MIYNPGVKIVMMERVGKERGSIFLYINMAGLFLFVVHLRRKVVHQ